MVPKLLVFLLLITLTSAARQSNPTAGGNGFQNQNASVTNGGVGHNQRDGSNNASRQASTAAPVNQTKRVPSLSGLLGGIFGHENASRQAPTTARVNRTKSVPLLSGLVDQIFGPKKGSGKAPTAAQGNQTKTGPVSSALFRQEHVSNNASQPAPPVNRNNSSGNNTSHQSQRNPPSTNPLEAVKNFLSRLR
jgi:hypothetical protein